MIHYYTRDKSSWEADICYFLSKIALFGFRVHPTFWIGSLRVAQVAIGVGPATPADVIVLTLPTLALDGEVEEKLILMVFHNVGDPLLINVP
jgi:hypothetical protein